MCYQVWLKQSIMTTPAVCHDKLVNPQLAAGLGSPYDDELYEEVRCLYPVVDILNMKYVLTVKIVDTILCM